MAHAPRRTERAGVGRPIDGSDSARRRYGFRTQTGRCGGGDFSGHAASRGASDDLRVRRPSRLLLRKLLGAVARQAGLKPILIPIPFAAWQALTWISEMLPNPPLTRHQVEFSVSSPEMPGFGELGISPHSVLQSVSGIPEGGQRRRESAAVCIGADPNFGLSRRLTPPDGHFFVVVNSVVWANHPTPAIAVIAARSCVATPSPATATKTAATETAASKATAAKPTTSATTAATSATTTASGISRCA